MSDLVETKEAGRQYSVRDWVGWGSGVVSDALRKCDRPFQAMDGGIRPLSDRMVTAGTVYTVRCYPGATWAMERALEAAAPGSVIVVDAGGRPDLTIMGGLMASRAAIRHLAGIVVDGAVRDVDDILATELPVFTRHVSPRAGTFAEIGQWQVTICCGRLPVSPGDWIVADRNGVVLVPLSILNEVAQHSERISRHERVVEEKLKEGHSLSEASEAARYLCSD